MPVQDISHEAASCLESVTHSATLPRAEQAYNICVKNGTLGSNKYHAEKKKSKLLKRDDVTAPLKPRPAQL